MTGEGLFEATGVPGHLAPTPERLERLLSKQSLEELYEVEEQPFARGKYATVRRCRERSTGKEWAAKFLRKRRRAQELRSEALHEVAVLDAGEKCLRLVSIHQVFETTTEMILILELAVGGELQTVLDRDEIPEEKQAAKLLKQILEGVEFLHKLNVAHLDIKPQNLVLTGEFPDCDVKLCDFGISRYISHGSNIREILGTPDYTAPEILNYEPISILTDMWSIGILLYVLLTGFTPFGADTKQETFCNISKCQLDFPDDLFEDVSKDAQDLIKRLIVKNPNERLSASECLKHPWLLKFEEEQASLPISCVDDFSDNTQKPEQEEETEFKKELGEEEIKLEEHILGISQTTSSETICSANPSEDVPDQSPSSSTEQNSQTPQQPESPSTSSVTTPTQQLTPTNAQPGLSTERRSSFKRNMDYLARKFTNCTELFETSVSGEEVFKCTPVFILGGTEEQTCSDSGSDTVSEISTDSSSDRSSIYSDDSLDFILYGKSHPGRLSFPFSAPEHDRWKERRAWPRECTGVVSKALSRFSTDSPSHLSVNPALRASSTHGITGLEALRHRGGNLVVIREPVRAGRYTRYSEVQCESVQARIRRFQIHGGS